MAIIQEEDITVANRLRRLEEKAIMANRQLETKETEKDFKYPLKWMSKFKKTHKKQNEKKILVWFLNKKNQIEVPRFMPIYSGNMIIWNNKPYEFDPRAVWIVKGVKGNPQSYLIKEIDRRPVRNSAGKIVFRDAAVSNLDLGEIRDRGDSTESDEFLIKMVKLAQKTETKAAVNKVVLIILGLLLAGVVIWLLVKK